MNSSKTIRGLFITGTNTDVGKTVITAGLARRLQSEGHSIGVYKPVCSGSEVDATGRQFWNDIRVLSQAVEHRYSDELICPQRFAAALAPPSAARLEGRSVDALKLRAGVANWVGQADYLLVEGIGGWLSPIAENETVADFAVDLGFPVVIVAAAELGTINHTLLTVEAVRSRGIPLAGIITNETQAGINRHLIEESVADVRNLSRAPMLAHVSFGDFSRLSRDDSPSAIDWISLMGSGRAATWTHRNAEGDEDGE